MADANWLDLQHPDYQEREPRRQVARVHYEANPNKLLTAKYLQQRAQGESEKQFKERLKTSDYFPAFAIVADDYTGRIKAAEEKVARSWQNEDQEEGLGSTSDKNTLAGQLWTDIDGRGKNYLTMRYEAAGTMIVEDEVWAIVEGKPRDENGVAVGNPYVREISPSAVLDWSEDARGRLKWVKVKHSADVRGGWKEEHDRRQRYTIYTREGYEVWEKREDKEGNVEAKLITPMTSYGPNPYWRSPDRNAKVLPVFRVKMPMKRYVGHILAHKNNVIFNKESERDNILRVANTPKGVYAGDLQGFVEQMKKNKLGTNTWQLDPDASQKHYYMAPPVKSAEISTAVLQDKVESFFVSAFQFYEDAVAGKQKTATEIQQDAAAEESFLNTVSTALDEFESEIGKRLEQIAFPDNPDLWGQFSVTSPQDFNPVDPESEADKLMRRYFDRGPVPVGATGRANVAKKIADLDDVDYDEEELEDGIQTEELRSQQARAAREGIANL